jgi:hypothetical protein
MKASGKIVRNAEWMLIIYQRMGDKLPTFKLVYSPRFYQRRTQFGHQNEKILSKDA